MSEQTNTELRELVSAVQDARDLSEEAARAISQRDAALDRLTDLVHTDRLGAIRKAHQRIGELTSGRCRS